MFPKAAIHSTFVMRRKVQKKKIMSKLKEEPSLDKGARKTRLREVFLRY